MNGKKEYLTDYVESFSESITFGDVVKDKVVNYETMNVKSMPRLMNVLHVEGMKANSISITQLCDDDARC